MAIEQSGADAVDKFTDMEERIKYIYERKLRVRASGPYQIYDAGQVAEGLKRLFTAEGLQDIEISNLSRMTGGGSKEQFRFHLSHRGASHVEKLVLRMDPYESTVETCRGREGVIIDFVRGSVPTPAVRIVDEEGRYLGRPGLVTTFVEGVTMPSELEGTAFSGIGGSYGPMASLLAPEFVRHLVAIHAHVYPERGVTHFQHPLPGTNQAAIWQLNALARSWRDDWIEPSPLMAYAERWLRENAPICEAPCLVHGDYRLGNFMYTEPSGAFTAVLDWEIAHFGDFHEDLGYVVQEAFSAKGANGETLVCGLMTREEFLAEYARLSGRTVNERTLRYYEVLAAYKQGVYVRASAPRAAAEGNNHQDLLIAWLASGSSVLFSILPPLIEAADAA